MALKIALVRTRDDNGELDMLLFDADLTQILRDAVQAVVDARPGAHRPVLRKAHDQAALIAENALTVAVAEVERRLKTQTINLT